MLYFRKCIPEKVRAATFHTMYKRGSVEDVNEVPNI